METVKEVYCRIKSVKHGYMGAGMISCGRFDDFIKTLFVCKSTVIAHN